MSDAFPLLTNHDLCSVNTSEKWFKLKGSSAREEGTYYLSGIKSDRSGLSSPGYTSHPLDCVTGNINRFYANCKSRGGATNSRAGVVMSPSLSFGLDPPGLLRVATGFRLLRGLFFSPSLPLVPEI